jgi:hypothetical protein
VLPLIYSLSVAIIKVSILLFYRRLFGTRKKLQRVVTGFMGFHIIFAVVSILTYAFMCAPVSAYWRLEMRVHGCPTFRSALTMYMTLRSITVICDIALLCLPMKMVWDLKIPTRQRLGLACLFALGFL